VEILEEIFDKMHAVIFLKFCIVINISKEAVVCVCVYMYTVSRKVCPPFIFY